MFPHAAVEMRELLLMHSDRQPIGRMRACYEKRVVLLHMEQVHDYERYK